MSSISTATAEPTSIHKPAVGALAVCSFVFFTSESLPVGLLPQLATGLSISHASVGLLITGYALVAGLTAVPLTAVTSRIPRHRLLPGLVAVFAASQVMAALAPDFTALVVARALCALAHGVLWSAMAPTAVHLGPRHRTGKVTSLISVGNTAGMVLGVPLATALGQAVGWRWSYGILGAVGAIVVVALLAVVPPLPTSGSTQRVLGQSATALRIAVRRPMAPLLVVVTLYGLGQFAAYTYLGPIVAHAGGLTGTALTAALFVYGAAGVAGNLVAGQFLDRHPGRAMFVAMTLTFVALVLLLGMRSAPTTMIAVALWGAGFAGVPAIMQASALRVGAQERDLASAVRLSTFQLAIAGGSLAGDRIVGAGGLTVLPLVSAALTLSAAASVLTARQVFPLRAVDQQPPSVRAHIPLG